MARRKGDVEDLEERFVRVFGQGTADVADEMMDAEPLRARVRRRPEESPRQEKSKST